jgi:predicted alpha/beta-hydrolase family hydrolase
VELLKGSFADRVFLGGQSYGGRQASMLAASTPDLVDGLLLLSYPLHPPGRPAQLRTAHFPQLRTAVLFVQGSRDPFGSPEEIEAAIKLIPGKTKLAIVEGQGHGLISRKSPAGLPHKILQDFSEFFAR